MAIDLSGVGNDPQKYFFETIIRKAHEGVVTAGDFVEFVGCRNWLVVDREDMPLSVSSDDEMAVDYVCEFRVYRVNLERDQVIICIDYGSTHTDTAMRLDADELAIRMDAS